MAEAGLKSHARARSWLTRLAAIDDGQILRAAFIILLIGTAGMLYIDYDELLSTTPDELPGTTDPSLPTVLPSVDRPELDPANPAFAPREEITSDPELLRQPMEMELGTGGVLSLTGTIGLGTAARLAEEIDRRGEYIETISLDSPGGAVAEALEMGRLIRENGYATNVVNGAFCASSCPLVFAGGETRTAGDRAMIGVHQIYSGSGQTISADQALSDAQVTTARIARYLEQMGVDQALWLHALETPPDRLYYLTPEEMRDLALVSDDGN